MALKGPNIPDPSEGIPGIEPRRSSESPGRIPAGISPVDELKRDRRDSIMGLMVACNPDATGANTAESFRNKIGSDVKNASHEDLTILKEVYTVLHDFEKGVIQLNAELVSIIHQIAAVILQAFASSEGSNRTELRKQFNGFSKHELIQLAQEQLRKSSARAEKSDEETALGERLKTLLDDDINTTPITTEADFHRLIDGITSPTTAEKAILEQLKMVVASIASPLEATTLYDFAGRIITLFSHGRRQEITTVLTGVKARELKEALMSDQKKTEAIKRPATKKIIKDVAPGRVDLDSLDLRPDDDKTIDLSTKSIPVGGSTRDAHPKVEKSLETKTEEIYAFLLPYRDAPLLSGVEELIAIDHAERSSDVRNIFLNLHLNINQGDSAIQAERAKKEPSAELLGTAERYRERSIYLASLVLAAYKDRGGVAILAHFASLSTGDLNEIAKQVIKPPATAKTAPEKPQISTGRTARLETVLAEARESGGNGDMTSPYLEHSLLLHEDVPQSIRRPIKDVIEFQTEICGDKEKGADERIKEDDRQIVYAALQYSLQMMGKAVSRLLQAEPKDKPILEGRAQRATAPLKRILEIMRSLVEKVRRAHEKGVVQRIMIDDSFVSEISKLRVISEGIRVHAEDSQTIERVVDGIVASYGITNPADEMIIKALKDLFSASIQLFPTQHAASSISAEELLGFLLETPLKRNSEAFMMWSMQSLVRTAGPLSQVILQQPEEDEQEKKKPYDPTREVRHYIQLARAKEKPANFRNLTPTDVPQLEEIDAMLKKLEEAALRPENQRDGNVIKIGQARGYCEGLIGYMILVPREQRVTPPFEACFPKLLSHAEAAARGTAIIFDASATTDMMRHIEKTTKTASDKAFEKLTPAEKAKREAATKKLLDQKKGAILGGEGKATEDLDKLFDEMEG